MGNISTYLRIFIYATLDLLLFFSAEAQQLNLQPINNFPTKEVYDLHVDRKGYLWIAHDLGISRFDGLSFIHFSNPEQASLSMLDIVEDNEGRIWCHNFSGQIFYIEQGQIKILKAYDYAKEIQFPRIVICGDELLATSDRGLFVCSTKDLSCKYIATSSPITSLAAISKRAILLDYKNWFIYEAGQGIRKINAHPLIGSALNEGILLQPFNYGNLLYLISNPTGLVQKIILKGDSLRTVSKYKLNDFVNSVSVGEQTWIHTRNLSKTLDGQWLVKGQSFTDAVKDKEGNIWFSSLKKGLQVSYKKARGEIIKPLSDQQDFIRCLNVADGYFFGGSNKGNLFVFDSTLSKTKWKTKLFDRDGSIEFIRFFKNHRFVVSSSLTTYIVNPIDKKVEALLPLSSVRDVDFDNNTLYLATTNGLYMLPYLDSLTLFDWQRQKKEQFLFLPAAFREPFLFVHKHATAVRFNGCSKSSLFVAFKNGLYEINKKRVIPFLIKQQPVFTSSMWYEKPRLFIATFNDGLWIKKDTLLRHYTTANFLNSNTILHTKVTKNHLWLFENNAIEVLDIETETLVKNIDLPKIAGADVFDIAEWNGYAYLTTADGIYKVSMNAVSDEKPPTGFLDAVIINNRDTVEKSGITVQHNENDIQFVFSSPTFYDPTSISFRYRLLGVSNSWELTKPGERTIRYASLPPGNYRLQAYAVNKKGIAQTDQIAFFISISKPWWNQRGFYLFCTMVLISLIYLLEEYRVRQLLTVEKIRRKISSDLHDDIGATLSSINVYAELVANERDNDIYLNSIRQHSEEVVTKMDELIWSINPKNDNFEQLASRMYSYASPLLKAKKIILHFDLNENLLKEKLPFKIKQHLYLIFKELINNVAKHSGASNCSVTMSCKNRRAFLTVTDNGKGFDFDNVTRNRNGIINIRERTELMKGYLKIESAAGSGTRTTITIPLPKNFVSRFKSWFKKQAPK